MTHPRTTPQAAKPGLPRLRPVVSCGVRAAAFALCFALSALMAFAPLNVKLDRGSGFHIESSKAHAVAPYVAGASEFLSAAAAGAGLTESEFVATVVGMSSTAIGVNLGVNAGVNYGESLGQNLGSLMDAANYPAWDSLDNSAKESWGTQEYYETAKFNSLCDAFGLGDARQRFHTAGGGNVDFNNTEIGILSNIGEIGDTWINRGNVLFEDIKGMLTPEYKQVFDGYMGQRLMSFDGSEVDGWPLPFNNVEIGSGNLFSYKDGNYRNNKFIATSGSVYWIVLTSSSSRGIGAFQFSLSGYNYTYSTSQENPPTNLTTNSTPKTLTNDSDFHFEVSYVGWGGNFYNLSNYVNMPVTVYSDGNWTNDQMFQACGLILKNFNKVDSNYDYIPDYPGEQDIPDEQPIYYPEQGITNNTVWNNYITQPSDPNPDDPENPPVVERPENPFNPDNQTNTQQWRDDTTKDIQGLNGIHFDRLFPFSMIYSIPNLVNVVRDGIATDSQAKNVVQVPFRWSDTYTDELYLDLTDLVNLLVMVRPFNRILLVFALLMALVLFWKSILTGD